MKKSPEKQFQQLEQFKRFLQFLNQKWLIGLALILTVLLFLFLPSLGYYQTLNLFWQKPKVTSVDVQVPVSPYPVNKTGKEAPVFSARSVMVMDFSSSVILYQKNPDLRLLPASTTKIMTALIVLENYQLDQILTVGSLEKNGQVIKLLPGEQMTVENLLYGLLVASGNDAATVLAQNFPAPRSLAGEVGSGGESAFIEAMNQKAQELNLTQTHFENPTGIDHPNHYSTALDLARLSVYALKNSVFARMVATPKITVWDIDHKIPHYLFNTNQLAGKNLGVLGVKTGWTQEAGECLVAYVEKNGYGIISVILGSQDRFGETERLINWIYENFEWEEIKISNF